MITEYPNFLAKKKFNTLVKKITASERWAFTGKSTNQSKPSFWYLEMYDDQKLVSIINDGIEKIFVRPKKLNACYVNGQSHGQCGGWHRDSPNEGDYTLLLYCNNEWRAEWGGFTVFQTGDIEQQVIVPFPNKAVLFQSNILHVGLEPTKHFSGLRTTLAFKFQV